MSNMKIVQFSSSAKTKIVAVFSSPQDSVIYSHLGEVEATDARYVTFMASFQSFVVV
jgi:hypothetical protein